MKTRWKRAQATLPSLGLAAMAALAVGTALTFGARPDANPRAEAANAQIAALAAAMDAALDAACAAYLADPASAAAANLATLDTIRATADPDMRPAHPSFAVADLARFSVAPLGELDVLGADASVAFTRVFHDDDDNLDAVAVVRFADGGDWDDLPAWRLRQLGPDAPRALGRRDAGGMLDFVDARNVAPDDDYQADLQEGDWAILASRSARRAPAFARRTPQCRYDATATAHVAREQNMRGTFAFANLTPPATIAVDGAASATSLTLDGDFHGAPAAELPIRMPRALTELLVLDWELDVGGQTNQSTVISTRLGLPAGGLGARMPDLADVHITGFNFRVDDGGCIENAIGGGEVVVAGETSGLRRRTTLYFETLIATNLSGTPTMASVTLPSFSC